jgi:hypothetical protein
MGPELATLRPLPRETSRFPRGKLASMSDVTRILEAIEQGDPKAANELLPLVYNELRKLAAHKMARETPGQTLQPTALLHEAWLRLVGNEHPELIGDLAEPIHHRERHHHSERPYEFGLDDPV